MGIVCVYVASMLNHIILFHIVNKGPVVIKVIKRSFMTICISHYVTTVLHFFPKLAASSSVILFTACFS